MRENTHFNQEIKDIIIADAALIIAFSLVLSDGIFGLISNPGAFLSKFVLFIPIAVVAVSLSFILHELMHKFVAQYYGAIAGFRTSYNGLIITLATGAVGFLLGIPGATMIYTNSFSRKENGIVSLAGPLTNFAVFAVFLAIFYILNPHSAFTSIAIQLSSPSSYINLLIAFTVFISLWLAFFNMLPITPLDGSKVLAWNAPVYIVMLAAIIGLLLLTGIIPQIIPLFDLIYVFFIALLFSMFYRGIL
jgi:Zn-dependent protease